MTTLTTDQLKQIQQQNGEYVLINTLSDEHFPETQIPGSINIPQSDPDFVQRAEKAAGGKDKTVVVYCANEQCDSSPTAAKKLDEAGFSKVFDYEAGAKGWEQSGEKLEGSKAC